MSERVVFYQLTQKYVHSQEAIPESARQVIYYTLAIGHHVGVLDCFKSLFEISVEDYKRWISSLPEGIGRQKLEGVLKWGEIEINSSHAGQLLETIKSSSNQMGTLENHWMAIFKQSLKLMLEEPALYLMGRKLL
jgi:hydrogenase-4 component J